VQHVSLFVEDGNPVAARLYGRLGFLGLSSGVPGKECEEWVEWGWEGVELRMFK
jgi:hypothetical protein